MDSRRMKKIIGRAVLAVAVVFAMCAPLLLAKNPYSICRKLISGNSDIEEVIVYNEPVPQAGTVSESEEANELRIWLVALPLLITLSSVSVLYARSKKR